MCLAAGGANEVACNKFWLLPAIVENSMLARIRLASNNTGRLGHRSSF